MTESHGLLTDLKTTVVEVSSVVHQLSSIEMWKNPNYNDGFDFEDDWYSSDTQDSFLDFEDECQFIWF